MYLSATLDHFGYAVPKLDSWKEDLWYDKYKFDDWFQSLRNRRRTREIMPHISIDSGTEDDDDQSFMGDDRPPSPGDDGSEGNPPGNGQGNPPGDGQDSGNDAPVGPSHPDSGLRSGPPQDQMNHVGNDSSSDSGQAILPPGTVPRREQSVPDREQLPQGVHLVSEDSVLILDAMGNILGSYDKAFPFSNWDRLVPCNPFAFCQDMSSTDFELGGLYDPRSEDIVNIINVGARGQHTKEYETKLLSLEDYAYTVGQLTLSWNCEIFDHQTPNLSRNY